MEKTMAQVRKEGRDNRKFIVQSLQAHGYTKRGAEQILHVIGYNPETREQAMKAWK